jgi:excisionase family DNA binding protein
MTGRPESSAAPHVVDAPKARKRYSRPRVKLKPNDDIARINIGEMAARLGVNPRTIRRMIRDDGLPCMRMGKNVLRFDARKVLEWFDAKFELTTGGANR